MCDAPEITNVQYDKSAPVIECEQIEMLLMEEEGEEGENSFARELFELYEKDSKRQLSKLDQICRDRDGESLRRVVHYIAGSAGNMGLMRLNAFYRGIENAIDEGVLEDYEACAELIPREFEISCKHFTEKLLLD